MFHTQNKIGLVCNLVEFTWVTGVEGAVWVEYAHPTPLGRREGHRKRMGVAAILGGEYLVFQCVSDDASMEFISKYHQGKDNMKTRTKTNLLCFFMFFHVLNCIQIIYMYMYMFHPVKTFASKSMATAIDSLLMLLRSIGG